MSHGIEADRERVKTTRNTARYFTETRHVAWVALVATVIWGLLSYAAMPKRKDPEIPVRVAAAIVVWPGAPAEKIEQLVTRKVEEKIAENAKIEHIDSSTRTGVAVVTFTLQEGVKDTGKEFDDVKLKLDALAGQLPQGVQPIQYIKDFGDTTALMLTVASPRAGEVEVQLRAEKIAKGIAEVRAKAARAAAPPAKRGSLVYSFPATVDPKPLRRILEHLAVFAETQGIAKDIRFFEGTGYMGLDGETTQSEDQIRAGALGFLRNRMNTAELHPDVWRAIVVFDPSETEAKLAAVAEARYSYRELDEYTDKLKKRLQGVPEVAKVTRAGVLPEAVYLDYSQERVAAYAVTGDLKNLLGARNITAPGGLVEAQGKKLSVDPSGELKDEREIGDVLMTTSAQGAPVYLRDLFDIERSYESPPRYLNKYTFKDKSGQWARTRAITLAVTMRSGMQIGAFGKAVDAALADGRQLLPEDLVVARTSDQPRQVSENVDLFMSSLYEAVALVVFVALLGFWEWRSAAVLALSVPITLFMTYGLMYLLGIDLQQISIASLIIALGLLVDDPVVAGDAIKRELALGHPPIVAAWLGPTKLARAILFATITNIVAYLPFLTLPGDVGRFIFTLPVVLTCSLVASRLVSMTFIPLLGFYFLRPAKHEPTLEERRSKGFGRFYSRGVAWAIDHRWKVLGISVVLLVSAFAFAGRLKQAFFPKDLSYLSYVDVWLPEDAPISATTETARHADEVIRRTAAEWAKAHPERAKGEDGKPRDVIRSITTFIGGGGPRFWFSVTPEMQQPNYAQLVIEATDKHDTSDLIEPLQRALSTEVPGARIDVRQLENGKPVGIPVAFRIQGEDVGTLREIAEKAKAILRASPLAERTRDSWGADAFSVKMEVDPDRANLAGVTNMDVAMSSAVGFSGSPVGQLREGDRMIPIVSRLRSAERAQLSDVANLYVRSQGGQRVPLRQISTVSYAMTTEKIVRRDHFRTITVSGFPVAGALPSQVVQSVRAEMNKLASELPPGYRLTVAGEEEEQKKGFFNLAIVLGISVFAIYLALVVQLKSAVKPLVVFAAIPYGVAGALVCLVLSGSPFGFMAFLGIISLIGVIVSHVIVLFDFIEERQEEGAPLREALLDAGILRLRPVLITVGATVFALFPLASHGGPLWEPLCYAQIGGLTIATFLTLLLVPVIYAIFVLDLKLVRWEIPSAT